MNMLGFASLICISVFIYCTEFDIRAALGMILRSNLFHDPAIRRRRVKGPVEFAVGTIRSLEALRPTVSADALGEACSRMGQTLYAPPSVAGWEGGRAWLNGQTLLFRQNLSLALTSTTDDRFGRRCIGLIKRIGQEDDRPGLLRDVPAGAVDRHSLRPASRRRRGTCPVR